MSNETGLLCLTALTVGFLHTVLGPDHYVPFVAMARAGGWKLRKTILVTLLCGLGHVLSSVALGLVGISFGVTILKLERIETLRGDLAGWLLVAFGCLYALWGLRRAIRNQPHSHPHAHADGTTHVHEHAHVEHHLHSHGWRPDGQPDLRAREAHASREPRALTPWVLFVVFLFGPCEPLIPLLMYPAAGGGTWAVVWVAAVFGFTTLATMTAIVVATCLGLRSLRFARFQRFSHALAGFVVLACGIAVKAGL